MKIDLCPVVVLGINGVEVQILLPELIVTPY
jgi:hypothetical protein